VELFYLSNGLLIPNYHMSYWMGLASTPADATFFLWVDGTPPPGIDRRYAHWGKLRLADKNAPRVGRGRWWPGSQAGRCLVNRRLGLRRAYLEPRLSLPATRCRCRSRTTWPATSTAPWATPASRTARAGAGRTPPAAITSPPSARSRVGVLQGATGAACLQAACRLAAACLAEQRPSRPTSRSALTAAAAGYVYVSPVTNMTYVYNTSTVDQRTATKLCNSQGGHLVAYTSLEEQQDVERYFINAVGGGDRARGQRHTDSTWCMADACRSWVFWPVLTPPKPAFNAPLPCWLPARMQGIMFPTYIKHYWIGLVANSTRFGNYNFAWSDPATPPPTTGSYIHWGRVRPSNLALQPDNFYTMENCGVANYTETFVDAFGWSDCQCNLTAPFICRMSREPGCRAPRLRARCSAAAACRCSPARRT
jgi:hypothetical protein